MMARAGSQRATLIAVAAIIASGVVAGFVLGRGSDAPEATAITPVAASKSADAPPQVPSVAATTATPAASAVALSEAELARLAEESMAGPAASRVAAIERLSRAPRDQALPALKRVLLNGDPAIDRPAALRGLQEMALAQGDGDQRIRDAVREVIYHGDDENLATRAQDTLDVIAESEAK